MLLVLSATDECIVQWPPGGAVSLQATGSQCYWWVFSIMTTRGCCVPAGYWFGVELEMQTGKHDGSVFGVRYFTCLPKYGVFAPPSRVQRSAITLRLFRHPYVVFYLSIFMFYWYVFVCRPICLWTYMYILYVYICMYIDMHLYYLFILLFLFV